MQSLFLVGEQRSGSNLLRLMIASSHEIAAPHPPHILQRIDPVVRVSRILDDDKFDQLTEIVCRLVETNPVPWLNTTLDREEVKRRCREKHVIAIYGAVMDIYAESNHARAWMCKSMQNIRWADHLNKYFGNNKYIYLHRDARDVALSFTKAVIGDKHPYFIASNGRQIQRSVSTQEGCIPIAFSRFRTPSLPRKRKVRFEICVHSSGSISKWK
jgi:hypothetical protein